MFFLTLEDDDDDDGDDDDVVKEINFRVTLAPSRTIRRMVSRTIRRVSLPHRGGRDASASALPPTFFFIFSWLSLWLSLLAHSASSGAKRRSYQCNLTQVFLFCVARLRLYQSWWRSFMRLLGSADSPT